MRTFGATAIPPGIGNTKLQAQVLYDMQATGWMGYPGFLMLKQGIHPEIVQERLGHSSISYSEKNLWLAKLQ